jgi:Cd2+/Zn2+-exporting ATPase
VQDIDIKSENRHQMLSVLTAVEVSSTHPVAKAIVDRIGETPDFLPKVSEQHEIPGFGVKAIADGKPVLIGSEKLMRRENIDLNGHAKNGRSDRSTVYLAVDGQHQGTIILSDRLRADASDAIRQLGALGVERTVMLSGDKTSIAEEVGNEIGIDEVFGDLLPDQKADKLEEIKRMYPGITAFAGDGINDAPVLALSDVGIAMGAMGSDVAIETADVVIQTDQPSKIATSIRISRATRRIVWQNIGLALGIKALVLLLGALGMATLWEAVFADVGVTLLAVLNAVRIQKMNFD